MYLPLELVDLCMKFSGAYHWDKTARPYVLDIKLVRNIIVERGVQASLLHIREYHALEKAYAKHNNEWPSAWYFNSIYPDAMHLM